MPPRKQNRVRIDAIINAIGKGEYDDKLADVRGAIDARLQTKRNEVLALVHEVYGEGYVVTPTSQKFGGGLVRGGQDVLLQSMAGGIPAEAPVPDALGDDPPVSGGSEADFESRSPVIGPYNPE